MEQVTFKSLCNFLNRLSPQEMAFLFLRKNQVSKLDEYDMNYLNHLILEFLKSIAIFENFPMSAIIGLVKEKYYSYYIDILHTYDK